MEQFMQEIYDPQDEIEMLAKKIEQLTGELEYRRKREFEMSREIERLRAELAAYPFCDRHRKEDFGLKGEWCIACKFELANERINLLEAELAAKEDKIFHLMGTIYFKDEELQQIEAELANAHNGLWRCDKCGKGTDYRWKPNESNDRLCPHCAVEHFEQWIIRLQADNKLLREGLRRALQEMHAPYLIGLKTELAKLLEGRE